MSVDPFWAPGVWIFASATILFVAAVIAPRTLRVDRNDSRLLTRVAVQQAELVRFAESHQNLVETQELLEGTIDGTTRTVREVHRGIASIPFGILEAIPATRDTTRIVRGIHDLTSDGVYGAISLANRVAGKGARKGLGVDGSKETE